MTRTIEFKTILQDPWNVMRGRIVDEINTYSDELEEEFGNFTIEEIPDKHEIKIVPEGASGKSEAETLRAYLSDWHADARLIVDDYWPTPEDYELEPNQVSDQGPSTDPREVAE